MQIAGQLKEAFKFAYENGDCAENIASAMHFAFKCAASVRNLTQISKNPVSVSSVAVAKAKEIFGGIGGMTAVVVGAGEMATLACKHLVNASANVIILNRDVSKAKALATSLGELASADSIEKLPEYVNRYRLFFSATASPEPIITDSLIEPRDFARYFFDIAVPRDVDLKENELVRVFAVDDLEEIVKSNIALREEQANIAYGIVARSVAEFFKWLSSKGSAAAIKALRGHAREIAEREIKKAVQKGYLRHCDEEEAKKLVHQVFKAFLHTPSVKLKDGDAKEMGAAIEYLFDVEIKNDEMIEE
jgi:glutamyl-tRNA reductase